VPEECVNISPDCLGSGAFDCAPAAQLCSRILPPAVCDFMSGLTWSVVVFTTTAAYHLAGRGRGSACSNVKSCAALKQNRLVQWLVSGGVCSGATG